ncbi:MAG: DUF1294 domain-containing protein [Erythrobacter sp.]|nr:DUF1294 domain-containing protein [Erythrobacter sp.]
MLDLVDPLLLVLALAAVNMAAFFAFWIDKVQARGGGWRLREDTLLGLALIGGTPGAYAARSLFRHKTRKQPFNTQLTTIAVLQVLVIGGVIGWQLGG